MVLVMEINTYLTLVLGTIVLLLPFADKYNLLVPILMKQMLLFDLTKTCDDLLKEHTESSKEEDRVKS